MVDASTPFPRRAVFLQSLRGALSKKSLWSISWLVPLALGLIPSLPWVGWMDATLENRYAPGELLASMDEVFRFDQRVDLGRLNTDGARTAGVLALLAIMWGIFSAGGWLQIFLERAVGSNVKRFLWGGARYFLRFLRVFLLTLLVLSFVTWLMHGWVWRIVVLHWLCGATDGDLNALASEQTVVRLAWIQSGVYALLFALVLVWGDYTRTRLAMHDTKSALWAGLCSAFFLLRHPLRTLRPYLFLLLIEAALVFTLGWASWRFNARLDATSGWYIVLLLLVLGQLGMLGQAVVRGARYHAAVVVSRWLIPPLMRPDPWPRRVGGPGGPQYPIDDTDEYGVSI